MCGTQAAVFAIGSTQIVGLLRLFVGTAKIHLIAAVSTKHKSGEDAHVPHTGRTAAGFADILDNGEYAFLNDRGLGVLKDYPICRIVPELLFALVGLLRCLEVYRVSQIVHALQNTANGFICPLIRISRRLVTG